MSTCKMLQNPPQTYSRLFRPWDTMRVEEPANFVRKSVKSERCTPPTRCQQQMDNDSDQDCASSINSSMSGISSCDDALENVSSISQSQHSPLAAPKHKTIVHQSEIGAFTSPEHHEFFHQHQHRQQQQQQQQQQQHELQLLAAAGIPTASQMYYSGAGSVLSPALPAGMAAPAPSSPSSYGFHSYTMGLMEQEYARVMAEDAQLRAINARKQRPKKFKCPHCNVAFSNNGQLKGHIRIHTGERPFKCDVESCGKTFTRNEELTRHKRIHTGVRPYPCINCGKKFGRRDHLKKHMKTHMPQEPQIAPAIFVSMYPYLYGY